MGFKKLKPLESSENLGSSPSTTLVVFESCSSDEVQFFFESLKSIHCSNLMRYKLTADYSRADGLAPLCQPKITDLLNEGRVRCHLNRLHP